MTATPNLKIAAPAISPDGTPLPNVPVAPNVTPSVEPQKETTPPPKSIADLPPVEETVEKPDDNKDKTVDFTEFLKVKDENHKDEKIPEVKKEVPKEEPKEVPKEEKIPDVKPTPQLTRQQLVEQDKKSRVVDDIEDPELKSLMVEEISRKAFDKIKPIILEHKKTAAELAELKKDPLHSSFYEHPQSYILTPEFAQEFAATQQAQTFLSHLENQYQEIATGAKTIQFPVLNQMSGQMEMKAFEATEQNTRLLMAHMQNARNEVVKHQAAIKSLEQTHQSKIGESVNFVENQRKQMFTFFEAPENKATYDPLIQNVIERFPAQFQRSPLMRILASSLVMNEVFGKMLAKQQQQQQQLPNQNPKIQAPTLQPSKDEVTGAVNGVKSGSSNDDITMDDFEKLKAGV